MGIAVGPTGELFVSDRGRERSGRVIWRIDAAGIGTIIAGTGRKGAGNGKVGNQVSFANPESLAVNAEGGVYVSDAYNHTVYLIGAEGLVSRVAGTGSKGFSGDGGRASEAMLNRPSDIRIDYAGNLFIADVRNHRVRKVDPQGLISTVVGTGTPGFSPDGTPAHIAQLNFPWGLAIDHEGRLLITEGENYRVRRVEHDGRLVTIAGNGHAGFDGDGGMATQASLRVSDGIVHHVAGAGDTSRCTSRF